jgi:HNH endonuclease
VDANRKETALKAGQEAAKTKHSMGGAGYALAGKKADWTKKNVKDDANNPYSVQNWYHLLLMSWGDGTGEWDQGNKKVIVGTDNNNSLHIRVFDDLGSCVRDIDETTPSTRLMSIQQSLISTLKQLLGLLAQREPNKTERDQVIEQAISIATQTRPKPPPDDIKILVEPPEASDEDDEDGERSYRTRKIDHAALESDEGGNETVEPIMLGAEEAASPESSGVPYVPTAEDVRASVERQIKDRRGRQRFRNMLRTRYGDKCLISGCDILDVVEAAHIKPYRGEVDNHAENGLLLRADLHTLFDLDLIGIEPVTLTVRVNPNIAKAGYEKLDGVKLQCSTQTPSNKALDVRWRQFQTKLRR